MASRLSLQQHDLDLRQRWAPPVTMSILQANGTYRVLSDGSVREGALDAAGKALLTGVPPGGAAVEFFREPTPVSGESNVWPRHQNKGKPLDFSNVNAPTDNNE